MSNLIEVHNLSVKRNNRVVLNVDHLVIIENEVLAVIGPNGAGKSTLLLTLSRLIQPEQGQITFRDQPIQSIDELTYRRRIALVLQEPLLLDMSVFDNVAVGMRFRGLSRQEVNQRATEWLERLGVVHLAKRRARQLSGGEAQRVSLARAFALQPELLLLDEPFSALDAPTRAKLLQDFHALLQSTSITTVFITHDLDEALYLGDRVAVLLQGRLRQSGIPQRVFSAPADPQVAAFVGVETVISARVIRAVEGCITLQTNGLVIEAIGEASPDQTMLICLRPEDITLHSLAENAHQPVSSARNRIAGQIQRLIPQGPLVRVVVDCGFPLVALITRTSAQELQLSEGKPVVAAFKASAIHLIPR